MTDDVFGKKRIFVSQESIYAMKRCLFLLLIALSFTACKKYPLPKISGHRGANFIAPENTMASLDSCISQGVDVMECDVVLSKDSVFYLLHDSLLNRTTNGIGPIREWLSHDLDTLDAGSWFGPAWKGQRIPRFADILQRAREGGVEITVDYRTGDFRDLVALVDSCGMREHTYFTFSSVDDTRAFRAMFPDIHTLQAYVYEPSQLDSVLDDIHPDIAVLWIDKITPKVVRRCHERDVQVLALILGLDDKTRANRRAIRLGVDVIATDKPEEIIRRYRK